MSRSALSTSTRQVQDLYSRFPYPPPSAFAGGSMPIPASLDLTRHIFWPDRSDLTGLRVLDAGCGTGTTAVTIAAQHPELEVLGIDLSGTSIERARRLAQEHGVGSNLDLRVLPIEDIGALGQHFDYIIASGVIHHLENPEQGLKALAEVLAPTGGIFIMVYATYGRAGVYMLQNAIRLLGPGADFSELVALTRPLLEHLPADHPFHDIQIAELDWKDDAGIVDLLLHVRDRSYTVPQLFGLLDAAGLRLSQFLDRLAYDPAIYLQAPELVERSNGLDLRARAEVAELLNGRLTRHQLYATRATYAPLHPPFLGLVLLAARPRRSPLFNWSAVEVVGKKRSQQLRVTECQLSEGHTREFDFAPWQFSVVREFDGVRTATEVFNLPQIQQVVPGDDADARLQRYGELLEILAAQEVILCDL